MENEIWKDIPNYEGLYQASNLGRIKSLDRVLKGKGKNQFGSTFDMIKKGRILKQQITKKGYLKAYLIKDGKSKTFASHRIIALTFIPNPDNYKFINHKDENKVNNRVDNLEWCTQSYNINYGTRNKKVSEKLKNIIKSKEWCENISKGKKGKIMSIEYREIQRKVSLKRKRNALGQFIGGDK
jgi:hypothetical protein